MSEELSTVNQKSDWGVRVHGPAGFPGGAAKVESVSWPVKLCHAANVSRVPLAGDGTVKGVLLVALHQVLELDESVVWKFVQSVPPR